MVSQVEIAGSSDLEQAVERAEKAGGIERAAEQLRPADAPDAVTLGAAVGWLRRRLAMVYAVLGTVAGLFADLLVGVGARLRAWRERLRTARVLVALREICVRPLYALQGMIPMTLQKTPPACLR